MFSAEWIFGTSVFYCFIALCFSMAFNILNNYASNEERALEFPQRNLLLRSEHLECQVCNRFMTVVKTGGGDRCPTHKGEKVFFFY